MPDRTELVLHVWPSRWGLPSFTPSCLASILYLQLTLPGKFVVEETTNPDLSPDGTFDGLLSGRRILYLLGTGQLPYLTHGLACIASFSSIVKYVDGLRNRKERSEDDYDEEYGEEEESTHSRKAVNPELHARQTAWLAYVSANLGDLVVSNSLLHYV